MAIRNQRKRLKIDTLEDLPSFYFRLSAYLLSQELDRRLEGFEVAKGTGKIATLLLIDSHPGISPSDVCKATFRDRPSVSRIIAPLVAAGLVEQRVSPAERRVQELYITDAGRKSARKVRAIVRENSDDFFADIDQSDRTELMRILKKIYAKKLEADGE